MTPAAAKRETQRRAAIAILALVVVSAGLFGMVWAVGGQGASHNLGSLTAGQAALRVAQDNLAAGVRARDRPDPGRPAQGARPPDRGLRVARHGRDATGSRRRRSTPSARTSKAGLDRIYGVVPVAAATILPFGTADVKADIGAMIQGPGGVPFVLDRTTKSVYRIDPATHKSRRGSSRRARTRPAAIEAAPKFIALGATRDLLIVDEQNVLWRWRPANDKGAGTTTKIRVSNNSGWGDDIRGDRDVPARRQRRASTTSTSSIPRSSRSSSTTRPATARASRPPRSIASPSPATCRRSTRCTSTATSSSPTTATSSGSSTAGPRAGRPTSCPTPCSASSPHYSLLASASDKRTGSIYAYDKPNDRVVEIDKAKGTYIEQYRLAGNAPGWEDIRGMYVVLAGRGRAADAGLGQQRRPLLVDPRGRPRRRAGHARAVLVRVARTRLGAPVAVAAGLRPP